MNMGATLVESSSSTMGRRPQRGDSDSRRTGDNRRCGRALLRTALKDTAWKDTRARFTLSWTLRLRSSRHLSTCCAIMRAVLAATNSRNHDSRRQCRFRLQTCARKSASTWSGEQRGRMSLLEGGRRICTLADSGRRYWHLRQWRGKCERTCCGSASAVGNANAAPSPTAPAIQPGALMSLWRCDAAEMQSPGEANHCWCPFSRSFGLQGNQKPVPKDAGHSTDASRL